jgi:hypothetical protein
MKRLEDETRLRDAEELRTSLLAGRCEKVSSSWSLRLTRLRASGDRLECAKEYDSSTSAYQMNNRLKKVKQFKENQQELVRGMSVPNSLISSKGRSK